MTTEPDTPLLVRDSNGTQLLDGDTVMVIKDLKVRGSSAVIKRGTLARNIRLTDDPAEVEYGSGKSTMVLKTEFVKRLNDQDSPMLTATHPAPRALADDLMTLADTLEGVALDVGTLNPDGSEAPADVYVVTWFVADASAPALQQAVAALLPALPPLAFTAVDETVDYVALTKVQFPPLIIGPFFVARNGEATPTGAIGLDIAPNRAFGSGEHATTTGCLHMYLQWAERGLSGHVTGLDYGAGSGILAIATAKHAAVAGVRFPFVCLDNDPPSVDINTHNGVLNGVESLLTCGVAEVPPVGQTFRLVFANILMQPLLDLADGLVACVEKTPQAGLILSGFTTDQGAAIEAAYSARGLHKTAEHSLNGWLAQLWQYSG